MYLLWQCTYNYCGLALNQWSTPLCATYCIPSILYNLIGSLNQNQNQKKLIPSLVCIQKSMRYDSIPLMTLRMMLIAIHFNASPGLNQACMPPTILLLCTYQLLASPTPPGAKVGGGWGFDTLQLYLPHPWERPTLTNPPRSIEWFKSSSSQHRWQELLLAWQLLRCMWHLPHPSGHILVSYPPPLPHLCPRWGRWGKQLIGALLNINRSQERCSTILRQSCKEE